MIGGPGWRTWLEGPRFTHEPEVATAGRALICRRTQASSDRPLFTLGRAESARKQEIMERAQALGMLATRELLQDVLKERHLRPASFCLRSIIPTLAVVTSQPSHRMARLAIPTLYPCPGSTTEGNLRGA